MTATKPRGDTDQAVRFAHSFMFVLLLGSQKVQMLRDFKKAPDGRKLS